VDEAMPYPRGGDRLSVDPTRERLARDAETLRELVLRIPCTDPGLDASRGVTETLGREGRLSS
jgi:hypothetical protein